MRSLTRRLDLLEKRHFPQRKLTHQEWIDFVGHVADCMEAVLVDGQWHDLSALSEGVPLTPRTHWGHYCHIVDLWVQNGLLETRPRPDGLTFLGEEYRAPQWAFEGGETAHENP